MKHIFSLIFICFQTLVFAQRFDWATSGGYQGVANSFLGAVDIAVDPDGNIYTLDFGNGIMACQGQTFDPFDSYTTFIYKFNPQGELIQVSRIGAVSGDFTPFNIECDDNGDIYVLGQPNGVTQLNINGNIVSAIGNTNQLIKINSNGVFAWKIDTGFASNGQGVMLQYNDGFVYYQSDHLTISKIATDGVIPPTFLEATYYDSTVASSGPNFKGSGVFSNGDLLFAAYSYGDIAYLVGNNEDADTLFNIGNAALTAPFLFMRVTPDFEVVWMTYLSNGRNPDKKFIPTTVDANDDVYACLQVNSDMTVGGDVISNPNAVFTGIGALVKLNDNGEGLWARTVDGNEKAYGWSITACTDTEGVWIGGGYSFTPDFGDFVLPTSSSSFPFLAKCNPNGEYTNVFIPTEFGQADVLSLASTDNGRYLAGGKLANTMVPTFSCTEIDPAKGFYLGMFSEQPNEVPQPSISQSNNVLTASPVFEGDIQWYLNGEEIDGANGQTYTATISGNYSVTYAYLTGCIGSAESDVLFANIVSVDEWENEGWNVFPNPVVDHFTLSRTNLDNGLVTVEICNAMGQVIDQKRNVGANTSFDMSSYAAGFYIVRIHTTRGIVSMKVQAAGNRP